MRALSQSMLPLWDLLGQYTDQPIYNLIGGRQPRSDPDLQHLCQLRQTSGLSPWESRGEILAADFVMAA